MMREVCFLIGEGETVLFADASSSASALPDSRTRWEAIWARRAQIVEIAHSHPHGPEAFSAEDESTMAALVEALGRAMRFSVVAPRISVVREYRPIEGKPARLTDSIREPGAEPWWADLIRHASGMPVHRKEGGL